MPVHIVTVAVYLCICFATQCYSSRENIPVVVAVCKEEVCVLEMVHIARQRESIAVSCIGYHPWFVSIQQTRVQ